MKIIYAESSFWDTHPDFTAKYEQTITTTFNRVVSLLPTMPKNCTFVCQTNDWECIPETGEGAYTKSSRLILLSINPALPHGEERLLLHSEAAILHELNHAVRFETGIQHPRFIDSCLLEGLATVFEQTYARRGKPLWGRYDEQSIEQWFQEIMDKKETVAWNDYMYSHPDGRRWIGYKVGTWLIERILQKSDLSIEELTLLPCDDLLRLSQN